MAATSVRIKPFLKWAGGKYRLLDRILPVLSSCAKNVQESVDAVAVSGCSRLVEPFAGAGAVFLNAPFKSLLICDCNKDIIALYKHLQSEGEYFIRYCETYFMPCTNTSEQYYKFRTQFNQSVDNAERSALFLYLNRHAYNGLVRYNTKGSYNVPFGRYTSPRFPRKELLLFLERLKTTDTHFMARDFRTTFLDVQPGDIVYCDPPYVPLTATANFTSYSGTCFSPVDQSALASLARHSAQQGIPVVVSNHDTDTTRALYTGATLETFLVQRLISCRSACRKPVAEVLAAFTDRVSL